LFSVSGLPLFLAAFAFPKPVIRFLCPARFGGERSSVAAKRKVGAQTNLYLVFVYARIEF
jgi:hypothetical protein